MDISACKILAGKPQRKEASNEREREREREMERSS